MNVPSSRRKGNQARAIVADPADAKLESRVLGGMLNDPAFSCGDLISQYRGPAFSQWRKIDANNVADSLEETIAAVRDGDMSGLEAALVSQVFALQSMFVDLATRARAQKSSDAVNALTHLALKAQSNSRATVQALTEMKFPRQTAFIKQTNVAHGAQQVNNGTGTTSPLAHAGAREQSAPVPNELLAITETGNGGTILLCCGRKDKGKRVG